MTLSYEVYYVMSVEIQFLQTSHSNNLSGLIYNLPKEIIEPK